MPKYLVLIPTGGFRKLIKLQLFLDKSFKKIILFKSVFKNGSESYYLNPFYHGIMVLFFELPHTTKTENFFKKNFSTKSKITKNEEY